MLSSKLQHDHHLFAKEANNINQVCHCVRVNRFLSQGFFYQHSLSNIHKTSPHCQGVCVDVQMDQDHCQGQKTTVEKMAFYKLTAHVFLVIDSTNVTVNGQMQIHCVVLLLLSISINGCFFLNEPNSASSHLGPPPPSVPDKNFCGF